MKAYARKYVQENYLWWDACMDFSAERVQVEKGESV